MEHLNWRRAARVELVEGYALRDASGDLVREVQDARIAAEGGFLHIAVPGTEAVQVVSAPALRLAELQPDGGQV